MNRRLTIYTLLYVAEFSGSINICDKDNELSHYVNCANLLNSMCIEFECKFYVVTNDIKSLRRAGLGKSVDYENIEGVLPFNLAKDTRFYAAHFKLMAIKMLLEKNYNRFIFLDLDVVLLKDFSMFNPRNLNGVVYDLYDIMVESYGADSVNSALNLLECKKIWWLGGEFIYINKFSPTEYAKGLLDVSKIYQSEYKNIFHVGDESVMTSIVSRLDGVSTLSQINESSLILRWWSVPVGFRQKVGLSGLFRFSILHLPADKNFLSLFWVFQYKCLNGKYYPKFFKFVLFSYFFLKLSFLKVYGLLGRFKGKVLPEYFD